MDLKYWISWSFGESPLFESVTVRIWFTVCTLTCKFNWWVYICVDFHRIRTSIFYIAFFIILIWICVSLIPITLTVTTFWLYSYLWIYLVSHVWL